MEDGNQSPITLEGLANAYQQIQVQFDNAQQQVTGLRNELAATRNKLAATQINLLAAQSSSGIGSTSYPCLLPSGELISAANTLTRLTELEVRVYF